MKQFGYDFPMIGLAKQFELVFVPGRDEPIELPRNSPALFCCSASVMKSTASRSPTTGMSGDAPPRCRFWTRSPA
jgi:hypothetical protein